MAEIPTFPLIGSKADFHIIIFSGFSNQHYRNDVLNAVNFFIAYGIYPRNIHCFVPPPMVQLLNQPNNQINVFDLSQYSTQVQLIPAKYVINLVTGHGSPSGIQFDNPPNGVGEIKPFDYFSPIHAISTLELGIFILGQCYAGIFNFWDSNQANKNYVFIGATGTHSSLNSELPDGNWGNVFLYFFSLWFSLSNIVKDVNGDSICDLLDCFKFASAKTSNLILENRTRWYREIRSIEISLSNPLLTAFEKDNLISKMNERIDALYSVQEPWILNANQARKVIL
jgi:hypothetical protein